MGNFKRFFLLHIQDILPLQTIFIDFKERIMDFKVFKKLLITFTAVLIFTSISELPLFSEYVFLKDGAILDGAIASDSAESVTLRLKDNKVRVIPRNTIMRILYTELYMGKVYVQKTDGKNVICYMVDEDRETYTFRKELFNPEEFSIKRDQVLFMARGNPTGLEVDGEVEIDRVALKWNPPYNPVKKYRINIKKSSDKLFKPAGETGSKSITLKDLKSNTKYQINVTAIDDAGDESLPSNELTITTKNVAPDKPLIESVEKLPAGGYKIRWKESIDSDGRIAGYRVYRKADGKMNQIIETKKLEYAIPSNEKIEGIYISTFDDLKAESDLSRVYLEKGSINGISISPAYLYPMGKLSDMSNFGFGVTFKSEFSNYLFSNLELSAELSVFYLPGKSGFIESESKVNFLLFVPVMATVGYAFYPISDLAVIPVVSAGGLYLQYDYNYFDIPSSKKKNISKGEVDPIVGAGLNLRYSLTKDYYLTMAVDYRMFFEEKNSYSYLTAAIGAGMRF